MAANTTRTATPHSEPFPPLDPASPPRIPRPSGPPAISIFAESPSLRSLPTRKSDTGTGHPSPKSGAQRSPAAAALQFTGQAAMADLKRRNKQRADEEGRQTTPNPQLEAVQTLLGGGLQSRPSHTPTPDKLSEPMRRVVERITVPTITTDEPLQTSPASLTSFGTLESIGTNLSMTATAGDPSMSESSKYTAEPTHIDEGASYPGHNGHLAVAADDGNKAFSYPGPPQSDQDPEAGPSRGMSLPGYGQNSPKSPASSKRHKCPYCATDFTRHHNLKSHLLTHSQEKPYVCQTCQARFRRLHDLKRHTKLHTGERPHTCDKCGRRFARGDALARHNKGPGGCAGRRSSFPGDDDFGGDDEENMDGVEYGGGDDEYDVDEQDRRVSEPSRKRAHVETTQDTSREVYRQHSSTYPPPLHQSRPHASSVSSMGPPQVNLHPGQNSVTSPRDGSGYPSPVAAGPSHYGHAGQVLNQSNMIESPKPLSPGHPPDQHRLSVGDVSMGGTRNRSPSLTTQFQQAHFGRGSGGRTPTQQTSQTNAHVPVLPPLQHSNQVSVRPAIQPASILGTHGSSLLHHQQAAPTPGPGSNPGSLSSHGRSSGSSMRDVVGQDGGDIWSYVRTLEQRFSRMQDEYELRISRLQEEVISLKGQMSNAGSYSSDIHPRY